MQPLKQVRMPPTPREICNRCCAAGPSVEFEITGSKCCASWIVEWTGIAFNMVVSRRDAEVSHAFLFAFWKTSLHPEAYPEVGGNANLFSSRFGVCGCVLSRSPPQPGPPAQCLGLRLRPQLVCAVFRYLYRPCGVSAVFVL